MLVRKSLLATFVALVVMAVSASSAMAWSNAGNHTFTRDPGSVLRFQWQNSPTTQSDCSTASLTLNLAAGSQDAGSVTAASLTGCSQGIPGCTSTITADVSPAWPLADSLLTANNNAQIGLVQLTHSFGGGGACIWNGVNSSIEGNPTVTVSYPAGAAAGCAAGQERTKLVFDGQGLVKASTDAAGSRGVAARLTGALRTACLSSASNPEMTS